MNSIHQVTEVSGWDISSISLLAKVELNGNEVPFFDDFIKAGCIQQPIQFDVKVLLQTGPQIHGKYFTGHLFLPILDLELNQRALSPQLAAGIASELYKID
jgi:hypothetical protein